LAGGLVAVVVDIVVGNSKDCIEEVVADNSIVVRSLPFVAVHTESLGRF
jgi:hypothetical protein